ncbi:unnamed protein product, partial [Anisakis simplex]|uniref:molybdopterin adenylyltransferase n=1 Tax=Anisakis simplex TaxID=6269 RepID=A0A0M3IZU7_ANISI
MEGDEDGSVNKAASELIRRHRQSDVLAEDITAIKPYPKVRMSIKDGYAVIASDGVGKRSVIHKTTAGMLASVSLKPNTVCRVNTGSMIPDGADAVVQVEDTKLVENDNVEEIAIEILSAPKVGQDIRYDIRSQLLTIRKSIRARFLAQLTEFWKVEDTKLVEHDNVEEIAIEILSAPKVGQDIREIGSDVAVGDILLPINTVVGSAEIGILLVDHPSNDRPLGLVRDTNRPRLLSLFRSCSARPIDIGIVPDSEGKLIDALNFAFSVADVIVSSGGVSIGEKDYLKSITQEHFKFDIHFGRVWMKPGLPTTFATGLWNGKKKAIFGLPGNPVSAWVTAQLFVVPMLKKIAGYGHYWPTV